MGKKNKKKTPQHKQYCNKFNKDFKNGPHKKKKKKRERDLKKKMILYR